MRLTALLSMAARVVVPRDYRYSTNRPWTVAAKRQNPPGKKRRKVFVEPIASEDWSVFKGDTVSNTEELRRSKHHTQELQSKVEFLKHCISLSVCDRHQHLKDRFTVFFLCLPKLTLKPVLCL